MLFKIQQSLSKEYTQNSEGLQYPAVVTASCSMLWFLTPARQEVSAGVPLVEPPSFLKIKAAVCLNVLSRVHS